MTASAKSNYDLSHLIPSAQQTALLNNAERIQKIRGDRWVGYPRAQLALGRLRELIDWPRKQRMPNLLIVGPSNNGKSMIIEKFRREKSSGPIHHPDYEEYPVVAIQMPSDPGIVRFYHRILTSVGAPIQPRMRVPELETLTISILRAVQARMLIIDELHNLIAGTSKQQREFLNLLRFLGNELRIPIVGVGTNEAYLAIRSDDQLENRFEPMTLPRWRDDDDLRSLLATFSAMLPLRRASPITSRDLARYILSRTEGTIGEITTLITRAAIDAIETGEETITPELLGDAQYSAPTERRAQFEKGLVR